MSKMTTDSEITAIDFHVGGHLIRAAFDTLEFYELGDTSKIVMEFLNDDLRRILAVAQEQVENS